MAAPRKYSDETRTRLLELVTEHGLSIREACRQLAQGTETHEPVNLPEKTAGEWVKQAHLDGRPILEDLALSEILDVSARGIFDLVNAEILRMDRAKGGADPEALLTLARTLKELQPLTSQARRTGKGQEKPESLLGGLSVVGNTSASANPEQPANTPVSARAVS